MKLALEILLAIVLAFWVALGWWFIVRVLHEDRRYIAKDPSKDCKRGATECVGRVK